MITRTEPSAVVPEEVLYTQPLGRLFPKIRDTVAGGERIQLFDDAIEATLQGDAWAAFAIGEHVVEKRPVRKHDRVVEFDLDASDLARGLGSLDVQVLDAERGTELPGAWVSFYPPDRQEGSSAAGRGLPGDNLPPGSSSFQRLPCGEFPVRVGARDHATLVLSVTIRPREATRLVVRLERERLLTGRVQDAAGKGIETHVEIAPLEDVAPVGPDFSVRRDPSYAEGGFRFEALPGARWVLRSSDPNVAFAPVVVDTGAGDVEELVVTVAPAVNVDLELRGAFAAGDERPAGLDRSAVLRVRDERGFVVRELAGLQALRVKRLAFLPGRYRAAFQRGAAAPSEREFVVVDAPLVVRFD